MNYIKILLLFAFLSVSSRAYSVCPDKQFIYELFKEYRTNIDTDPDLVAKYCSLDYDVFVAKKLEDENNSRFLEVYKNREQVMKWMNMCQDFGKSIRSVFNYDTKCINDNTLDLIMGVDTYLRNNRKSIMTIRYTFDSDSNRWKSVEYNYGMEIKDDFPKPATDVFK